MTARSTATVTSDHCRDGRLLRLRDGMHVNMLLPSAQRDVLAIAHS
jgi:hypothetical protein